MRPHYKIDFNEQGIIEELSEEVKKLVILADYTKAERSYTYGHVNGFELDNVSINLNKWEFKEHKYSDIDYFNTLKLGQFGYVLREYDGNEKYNLYPCNIVLKDEINKTIIFHVYEMHICDNNIINQLK